jgi:AGCS family alanine or glycine:cation symporter
MKIKLLFSTLLMVFSGSVFAENIDDKINEAVAPYLNGFTSFIFMKIPFFGSSVPWVVIWLVVAASFFTLYFKFINLRSFGHGMALLRGKYCTLRPQERLLAFKP